MHPPSPHVLDFATRSFRDIADQDYIAARRSHRDELVQPFLWSAQQSVEKYLKGILLFHGKSAKGVRHDVEEAFSRVLKISDLEFVPQQDVTEFVSYINRYGQDRYLSAPVVLLDTSLLMLDKTVWSIRPYCQHMRQVIKKRDGVEIDLFPHHLQRVKQHEASRRPERFRIRSGYLEKVIESVGPAYESLTWKNFFFGRRHKKRVKNLRFRSHSSNPTHALHPATFADLEKLVDFPREVARYYRALAASAGKQ